MKKTLLLLALNILPTLSFSQQISLTAEGFKNTSVTICENKTQEDLYKKTLEWTEITFVSPDDVVKAKIENEYIRIRGSKRALACYNTIGKICNDAMYTIEISFKEGKYRFEVIDFQENVPYTQYTRGGWTTLDLNSDHFFNKKGAPKTKFKDFVVEVPAHFNSLNNSLYDFIINENIPSKREDW